MAYHERCKVRSLCRILSEASVNEISHVIRKDVLGQLWWGLVDYVL